MENVQRYKNILEKNKRLKDSEDEIQKIIRNMTLMENNLKVLEKNKKSYEKILINFSAGEYDK